MFRLFDFSSPIDRSTDQLVVGAILFLFLTCFCAYFIYNRDQEARRLVGLGKLWGKRVEDDAKLLHRTKIQIVVTYSVTLVLCLFLAARVGVELLRRL